MTHVYIICGLLAALIILLCVWLLTFRLRARLLVKKRSDEEKMHDLNQAIESFGFNYNLNQDIFFSKKDSWQRNMGYSKIYDDNAINTNMVIDCEPFYFNVDNRSYMLEVWKGQYGLSTGAEVGFYVTDEINREHPEKLFYQCVTDEEMLSMRFVLKKKKRILMIRDEIHWWLTGFIVGEFSNPDELEMEVTLGFEDYQMRNAFCVALAKKGYQRDDVTINGLKVSFLFKQPYSEQPKHLKARISLIQKMNKHNCKRYYFVTRYFTRTLDRLDYIGMCFPGIYKMLGKISKNAKKKSKKKDNKKKGDNKNKEENKKRIGDSQKRNER